MKTYKNNSAKAYNMLISTLEKGIKGEMVDVEDEKYYTIYKIIIDAFASDCLEQKKLSKSHHNIIEAQQGIIEKINQFKRLFPDDFLLLAADALEYRLLLNRRNLKPGLFPMTHKQSVGLAPLGLSLVISLPLFIYSFINIMLPIGVAKLVGRKIQDAQFVSSVLFTVGILLTPIFHAMQIAAFAIITGNLAYTLAYAVSLPLSFYMFFGWKKWWEIFIHRMKEVKCKTINTSRNVRLYGLHKSIKEQLRRIVAIKDETDYLSSKATDY